MNHLTISEAAKLVHVSERRIQQMCKGGEFQGAHKEGRQWLIPQDALESVFGKRSAVKKPLPIGISDYKIASTDCYYVDKTLLIRDFLDRKPLVSLFTRPRRFGKTLNMKFKCL